MGKTSPLLLITVMAIVFFVVLFMIGFIVLAAAFTNKGGGDSDSSGGGTASFENCDPSDKAFRGIGDAATGLAAHANHHQKPPAKWIPLYEKAAGKHKLGDCGAAVLAGIHAIENNFGGSSNVQGPPTPYGTAKGPFQFIDSTWAAYGDDCDGDGRKDVYNIEDGVCGAAKYLKASGAPGNWKRAIFAYNHDNSYVDGVLVLAKRFSGG